MTTWLTAFTAWPEPTGPKWVIVRPSASRIGRARETDAASPPTKIVRVAFRAPSEPPEPGASPRAASRSRRRSAKARVADGLIVEVSITMSPGCTASATPWGPKSTASTSGVSETDTTTTSAARATSAGDDASLAPASTSGPVRPGERFQTVVSNPARARLSAIADPIVPSPITPTRSTATSVSPSSTVRAYARRDEGAPDMADGGARVRGLRCGLADAGWDTRADAPRRGPRGDRGHRPTGRGHPARGRGLERRRRGRGGGRDPGRRSADRVAVGDRPTRLVGGTRRRPAGDRAAARLARGFGRRGVAERRAGSAVWLGLHDRADEGRGRGRLQFDRQR